MGECLLYPMVLHYPGGSWGCQYNRDFSEASNFDSTHVSDMDDSNAAPLTSELFDLKYIGSIFSLTNKRI